MYAFYQRVQSEIVDIRAMLDTLSELCTRRMVSKAELAAGKAGGEKGRVQRKESGSSEGWTEKRETAPALTSAKHGLLRHSKTMNADSFTASLTRFRENSASDKKAKDSRKKDKKDRRQLLEKTFVSADLATH